MTNKLPFTVVTGYKPGKSGTPFTSASSPGQKLVNDFRGKVSSRTKKKPAKKAKRGRA